MIFQIILYAVLKELILLFASADFSSSSLPPVDFVCEYACVNLILESFTLWNSMRPYLKLSLWSSFVFASVRVSEFSYFLDLWFLQYTLSSNPDLKSTCGAGRGFWFLMDNFVFLGSWTVTLVLFESWALCDFMEGIKLLFNFLL